MGNNSSHTPSALPPQPMNTNVSADPAKNEFVALIMGKPLEVARTLAKERGYDICCRKVDGVDKIITDRAIPYRCNVIVNNGMIRGCTGFI